MAGLVAVLLMGLVLRRRVVLTALGLLVASLASFILALRFVYAGAGGQGLAIHPFETGAQMASRLGVSRLPFDEVPL